MRRGAPSWQRVAERVIPFSSRRSSEVSTSPFWSREGPGPDGRDRSISHETATASPSAIARHSK